MKPYFCVMSATAVATLLGLSPVQAEPLHHESVYVAAMLSEVQSGSVGGRDYLTIRIDGAPAGPAACRSTVLKVDTGPAAKSGRTGSIEAVALAAMLNQDPVMITIPLDPAECRDGRPTFTDLYLLPASP